MTSCATAHPDSAGKKLYPIIFWIFSVTAQSTDEVFSKYVKRAKAEHKDLFLEKTYTPHSMRHTTAVHMIEAGVPLIVIKQFLGHSSISSTEVYAKMSQSTVNEKLKEWDAKYWHGQYIDSPDDYLHGESKKNIIPDFLR